MNNSRVSADLNSRRWYDFLFQKRALLLLAVFIFYIIIQFLANWSIILGENLMKWDIMDAYYPSSVMLGDVIKSGTVPMWNPLMMFGLPYYTVVGMPIWYPSTLILSLIGYTPSTVAVEYALHTVIAAFGAFLFIEDHLRKPDGTVGKKGFVIAVLAGLIYGNSTVFLSNAEHIMIIVSAAWLPYVLYAYKKYMETNKLHMLLLAGACAGLSFLGGYPELFVDMFLFLIAYTLYFQFKKGRPIGRYIGSSVLKYVYLCLATFASCALLAIPFFLSHDAITRADTVLSSVGVHPVSLLSTLMPGIGNALSGVEVSMMSVYIGIFSIVALPAVIKSNYKHKRFYLIFTIVFLILSFADVLFLHALFLRFIPMYDSLRFPSIVRCFVALFMLLLAAKAWLDLFENAAHRKSVFRFSEILFIFLVVLSILCFLARYMVLTIVNTDQALIIGIAAFYGALLTGFYMLLTWLLKNRADAKRWKVFVLFLIVCTEVLMFVYIETPYSIATYLPTQYAFTPSVQQNIALQFSDNQDRNRSVELSGSVRTNSGLNSKAIVFAKTFDEDGYLSYKFTASDTYRNSYNCIINEQNPEIFFTDNIATGDKDALTKWLANPTISPDQIFIENGNKMENTNLDSIGTPAVIEQKDVAVQQNGNSIDGKLDMLHPGVAQYPLLRLYVAKDAPETVGLTINYMSDGGVSTVKGDYIVRNGDKGKYVDLYYPDPASKFTEVMIDASNTTPQKLEALRMQRIPYADGVHIDSFEFNSLRFTVDAKTDGYVTVMQMKYPGWHAYVDGKETDSTLVDGVFMGFALSKGQHTIEMQFKPTDFFVGIGITIAYWGFMVVVLVFAWRKSRKNKALLARRGNK